MARHGENIHKRKDGRYEGRYIKARDAAGHPVWGYVYSTSYKTVKETLLRRKAESGYYALADGNPTFEQVALLWLASISCGVKKSTQAHYLYTLQHYIFPVLLDIRVKSLTEAVLEQALLQIFAPTNGCHAALGNSVARECLVLVRRICKYACHLRLMRPVEIEVKLPQQPKKEKRFLREDEQHRLYKFVLHSPTPRKIGVLLAMQMGLRIGEICGLQWGDFDLSTGTITIQRTVKRIGTGNGRTEVVIQTPKTATSMRVLPVPAELLDILRQLHGNYSDETWFLSGSKRKPVEPRCYRKSIHGYLRRAKVAQVCPHALRHTFATTCLQAGCDIKTLSELMGHANSSVTLQCYVHTTMDRKRWEIDRIFGSAFALRDIDKVSLDSHAQQKMPLLC